MQCLIGSPMLTSFFFVNGLELLVDPFLFRLMIFLLVVLMLLGLHVSSSESSLSSYASSSVSSSTSFEKLFFVETGIHVTNSADELEKSSSSVLEDSSLDMLGDSSSYVLVHSSSSVPELILYRRGKDNGVNILKFIDEGPYKLGTFRKTFAESTEGTPQFGPKRPRVYSDLKSEEKDRYNADIRATNILL
nr:hypothetical protein [Tanacetum cinerariifolium]